MVGTMKPHGTDHRRTKQGLPAHAGDYTPDTSDLCSMPMPKLKSEGPAAPYTVDKMGMKAALKKAHS